MKGLISLCVTQGYIIKMSCNDMVGTNPRSFKCQKLIWAAGSPSQFTCSFSAEEGFYFIIYIYWLCTGILGEINYFVLAASSGVFRGLIVFCIRKQRFVNLFYISRKGRNFLFFFFSILLFIFHFPLQNYMKT